MAFFKLGISADVGTQVVKQPVITCRCHVFLNTIRYVSAYYTKDLYLLYIDDVPWLPSFVRG